MKMLIVSFSDCIIKRYLSQNRDIAQRLETGFQQNKHRNNENTVFAYSKDGEIKRITWEMYLS